jgi:glucose dehydrogenase
VHDHERVGDGPADLGATATGGAAGRLSLRRAVALAAVFVYGWWAVGLTPFSLTASLAVVLAGGVAAVLGSRARAPASPREGRSIAPWLLLIAAAGVVQLSAYLQHPREDHPTLSSLTNALLDSHPARAAAFVAWLVAAAELARR